MTPWQPSGQVADQFRCGRVVLLGVRRTRCLRLRRRSHRDPSARDLAWKLAATLNGTAGPGLFDTCHVERHPVGRFAARASLTGPGASFLPLGDDGRHCPPRKNGPCLHGCRSRYRSAAVVTDEPAPTDPDAVQLVDARNCAGNPEPACRTHGCDATARASPRSICSERAHGFAGSAGTPWVAAADKVSTSLLSRSRSTSSDPMQASETSKATTRLTGLSPDGAMLVRPDDFVAWRAEALPDHRVQTFHQVLCRTCAGTEHADPEAPRAPTIRSTYDYRAADRSGQSRRGH